MALTLPGHSAPAVGFEVPLEMLAACHGRVQHQCETLLRLVTHLQTHGADRPAQEAASAVMRYFDTAARHHHEDEEQDLFPALLESMAGSDAVCLRELTASLCSDHRLLEQRWAALRQRLCKSQKAPRQRWPAPTYRASSGCTSSTLPARKPSCCPWRPLAE
jgi:iron-sulfur cluster repair protein YtfE (RIC family)